jgi:hypothetical protein
MHKICHIIGGGPSLAGFDWNSLSGNFCIAINDAFKVLPRAQVVMFSVHDWLEKNRRALMDHAGLKFSCTKTPSYDKLPPRCVELHLVSQYGLTMTRGEIHGINTGHMALNLAVQWGFREIWLYGFDMRREKLTTHWHDGAVEKSPATVYEHFRACIDSLAPELAARGVRVWNLSPGSALKAYPKIKVRPLSKPDPGEAPC